MCYREVWNQTGAELRANLEGEFNKWSWFELATQEKILALGCANGEHRWNSRNRKRKITWSGFTVNFVQGILMTGVPYLRARNICVTELPKRFWKVQYPLLNPLETRHIGVDFEGANIPWRCIELNRRRQRVY